MMRLSIAHIRRVRAHRYGSSANLVLTTGHGVNGYTLDASLGEFILTHPNVGLKLRFTAHPVLSWK